MDRSKSKSLNYFGTFLESVQKREGAPTLTTTSSKTLDLLRVISTHSEPITIDRLQSSTQIPILKLVKELDDLQRSEFIMVDDAGERVCLTPLGENVIRIAG